MEDERRYLADGLAPASAIDCGAPGQFTDPAPAHLWPCGCLRNDAGAHRVGCPDYPEGRRGR